MAMKAAEASLLALTADAAAPEEAFVRTATGAATMLASVLPQIRGMEWNCAETLGSFLKHSQEFSSVRYVTGEGRVACASSGQGQDVSGQTVFRLMKSDPRTRVITAQAGSDPAKTEVIVIVPVPTRDGGFDGYRTLVDHLAEGRKRLVDVLGVYEVDQP